MFLAGKKAGCSTALIIDGGLKPTRKICSARKAGIFCFKNSGYQLETDRTKIPCPGKKYCSEDAKGSTPSLSSASMSKILRKF